MRRGWAIGWIMLVLAACGRGGDGPAPVTYGNDRRAGDRPASAASASVRPVSGPGIHTVARGETLSGIAARYGVRMGAMAAVNDLEPPYTLRIGQRLRIPKPRRYTVARGDTVYGVARRFRVPIRAIIEANDLQPPYRLDVDQTLRIPQPRVHEVVRGDTLYSISRRYDVPMSELARLNGLSPPYTITPGQELLIPAGGTRIASARRDDGDAGTSIDRQDAPAGASDGTASADSASGRDAPDGDETAEAARSAANDDGVGVPKPEPKPAAIKRAAREHDAGEGAGETQTASRPEAVPDPPARSNSRFAWPLRGEILTGYGPQPNGLHNDGLNIAAGRGTPVKAAANGVVAYVGNELRGFGNLVLIKHADSWVTAYAHLDTILVERGEKVARGEPIARVGSSGGVTDPQLHFETRRGTEAVDPKNVLGPTTASREAPATRKASTG